MACGKVRKYKPTDFNVYRCQDPFFVPSYPQPVRIYPGICRNPLKISIRESFTSYFLFHFMEAIGKLFYLNTNNLTLLYH